MVIIYYYVLWRNFEFSLIDTGRDKLIRTYNQTVKNGENNNNEKDIKTSHVYFQRGNCDSFLIIARRGKQDKNIAFSRNDSTKMVSNISLISSEMNVQTLHKIAAVMTVLRKWLGVSENLYRKLETVLPIEQLSPRYGSDTLKDHKYCCHIWV